MSPEAYLDNLVAKDALAEVKLGLARVTAAWQKLADQLPPLPFSYTIAGTNGKGTCAALLELSLRAAGLQTGLIASPHLLSFNERIKLNGRDATDAAWLAALRLCVEVKQDIPLTYFEYCTLAGLIIFAEQQLDVVILEVGLGGRLDATNVVDTDCAILTSIALDHTELLGTSRAQIAAEKLGIARRDKPLVVGESKLPDNFSQLSREIGCRMLVINQDFGCVDEMIRTDSLAMTGQELFAVVGYPAVKHLLKLPQSRQPTLLANLAVVWQAFNLFSSKPQPLANELAEAWRDFSLPGRWQRYKHGKQQFILDCGHNPAAAEILAKLLVTELAGYQEHAQQPVVEAIFAIKANKNLLGVLQPLLGLVTKWHLFKLQTTKGLDPTKIQQELLQHSDAAVQLHSDVAELLVNLDLASTSSSPLKLFLVFGSFHTVGEVLSALQTRQ